MAAIGDPTSGTPTRQQLAEVFSQPRVRLAMEALFRAANADLPAQIAAVLVMVEEALSEISALRLPEYIVGVPSGLLTNGRVLTGGTDIAVSLATPGEAIVSLTPAGTSGQVQYNNSGALGGFTVSGDGTLNTTTGALIVTKLNGVSPGYFYNGTDAANLTGTVSVNRFNSGTGASGTTYLDGNGHWTTPGGSGGTVTSVGLTAPSIFTVTGSPVTTSGTLAFSLNTQAANLIFAGPSTGAAATPTFRSLVATDLPNTAVTPGTYGDGTHVAQVVLDAQGRATGASNVAITFPAAPTGANPTATASDVAVNGAAATFMRSDAAPAIQKTSASQFGLVKVDGTTITAAGGVASAVAGSTVGAPFHPGFASGRYYGAVALSPSVGGVVTANVLVANPFYVPFATTFTEISVGVAVGVAASAVKLGIYANANGAPGAIEYDAGAVATTVLGPAAITGTFVLSAGWHWLAYVGNASSNLMLAVKPTIWSQLLGVSPQTATAAAVQATLTYPAGALPTPFPTAYNSATGSTVMIYLRL